MAIQELPSFFTKHPKQFTLGMFIARLQEIEKKAEGDLPIVFDFVHMAPDKFDSYRGYCDHLALGYIGKFCFDDVRVSDLLKQSIEANGKEFYGWKGGDYTMSNDTPLWVANPGETGSTAITGIKSIGYMAIIKTKFIDD